MAQLVSQRYLNREYLDNEGLFTTDVPIYNLIRTGKLNGKIRAGIHQVAGDSRTYKTLYGVMEIKHFLNTFDDGVAFLFDSEFGASSEYFISEGIDPDRIIHVPIESVEDLKVKAASVLSDLTREDNVYFIIDSVGQLASLKEIEDSENDKVVADMTRAKQLNSLWRIITAKINSRGIPCYVINSAYDDISNKYADPILKGGKGGLLAANSTFYARRSKNKSDDKNEFGNKVLEGFTFTLTNMKGRDVKEDVKAPIEISFENGIYRWSGMLEIGRYLGAIEMLGAGRYKFNSELIEATGIDKSFTKNQMK